MTIRGHIARPAPDPGPAPTRRPARASHPSGPKRAQIEDQPPAEATGLTERKLSWDRSVATTKARS
jgi:hypothetical protein